MKRLIKIKNITYLMLSLLAFPFFVFAAVDHSYPSATSPIRIQVTADDYDKNINCGGLQFWGVQVVEHITGEAFFGSPRFVPASVLSQEFTIDMPPGDYEEITFICSDDGDNTAFQLSSIGNDLSGDQVIFSVPSIPAETPLVESNSPTSVRDFAQMVFGSESDGTAISAFSDIKPTPIISTLTADINDTATSTITTVDIDGTSIVTTSSATTEVSAETTTTDSLANVISAFDDTVSATSNDSSTTVGPEEQIDTVIVSDTNAPSITSPISESDETTTSTVPEVQDATLSITADTNGGGTTTAPF